MEVNVKAKYEVHIYMMLSLPYIHDHLLKGHSVCWVVPISADRRRKSRLNMTLGRFKGGQGQNKIGGVHLHHVVIAIYA